jgi:hypothetical protein
MNRAVLSFVVAALGANALAWSGGAHMVIAAIAEQDLRAETRLEADRLLKIGATERAYDFITAGPWADDIRSEREESGPWHYTNIFFRQDGRRTNLKPLDENIVVAIERFTRVLQDKSRPDSERADALRYLIHFVGDAHQPLHTTARVTARSPEGDRGGNDFAILPPLSMAAEARPPRNLHALWDSGAGLFSNVDRPLTRDGRRLVWTQARTLVAALPRSEFRNVGEGRPAKWAEEGHQIARTVAYQTEEGAAPNAQYMRRAQDASARQVTLAGYRLADLLNRVLL